MQMLKSIKTSNFRINQIKDSLSQYSNISEELEEFNKNQPVDIKPEGKARI